MKKGLTELVFILDKSGSMAGLEKDTIGGYNSMLQKQKEEVGECVITTVLFDHGYQLLHDRINIKAVNLITDNEYQVGGSTALLDAIGKTINKIASAQHQTSEDYKAEKVMFVIITDGEENASREYSINKIKQMIELQKKEYNWEFIFLGANIDAVATAKQFGIDEEFAAGYKADHVGTWMNYEVISESISDLRVKGKMDSSRLRKIREYKDLSEES